MFFFTSDVASLILVPWKLNHERAAGGWEPCEWQWKVEGMSAVWEPVWDGKMVTSRGGTANNKSFKRWSQNGSHLEMPCCCFSELYVLIYEASFESVELWIKCFCQVVIFVSKTSTANCYCRRLENPRAASRGRNKCWNWQMAAIGICVIEWRGLLTAGSSTSMVHWTGNSIIYINILFDSKCITSTQDSSQMVLNFSIF